MIVDGEVEPVESTRAAVFEFFFGNVGGWRRGRCDSKVAAPQVPRALVRSPLRHRRGADAEVVFIEHPLCVPCVLCGESSSFLGLRVATSGFRARTLAFWVQNFTFRAQSFLIGCRVSPFGCRVSPFGCRASHFGSRTLPFGRGGGPFVSRVTFWGAKLYLGMKKWNRR